MCTMPAYLYIAAIIIIIIIIIIMIYILIDVAIPANRNVVQKGA